MNGEDYAKYQQQNKIVCELCSLFESEHENDSDDVKKERTAKVIDLMQKVGFLRDSATFRKSEEE